jgi:hypothetical protein
MADVLDLMLQDLADETTRLAAADLLAERGRAVEAALLLDLSQAVVVDQGTILPLPRLTWSRSIVGEQPGVLLGADRILLHLATARGRGTTTDLICFDLDGCQLWSQPDRRGLLSLPAGRFLVSTPAGQPLIIDSSGATVRCWKTDGITAAARHHELLILADAQQVWAADLELNPLWRLAWPGKSPVIDCFLEETFYWAEQNEVKYATRDGRSGTFAQLADGLIAGAMDRYEQMRGSSGIVVRDFPFRWRFVSFDEGQRLFLLANFIPHLVVCLDPWGRTRWCECLGPGCCGGSPHALPNGLYVASGGCNGILSWLDADGNVLFQTVPHEGVGLATAYSHELRILPGGRVLADGGPGLVAYSAGGNLLWKFGQDYSQFHCDPERHILVGWRWQSSEPNGPNMISLECIGGV